MIVALVVAAFASALALDYAGAHYQLAVRARRAHVAARWSVAMFGLGLVGISTALDASAWLALASAAGLYAGTWLALGGRGTMHANMETMRTATFSVIFRGTAPDSKAVEDAARDFRAALVAAGCSLSCQSVESAEHLDLGAEAMAKADAEAPAAAPATA